MQTSEPTIHVSNLILGGGTAAGYAARAFAEAGRGEELAIVSAERRPPMHRPPLSKDALEGEASYAEIGVNDIQFYEDYGIRLWLNTPVTEVDLDNGAVATADHVIGFDRLLIATGCRVRPLDVPGADLPQVHHLRTTDQSRELREAAANAGAAVVVGSGFIGNETAAVLAQEGVDVTMVFPGDHVWPGLFDHDMAAYFERHYADRGVRFRPKNRVTKIRGRPDGTVEVVLTDDALVADLVVVGIGAEPAVELFEGTPLELDDGVVTDECLRTNVPGVWAAGDVANAWDPFRRKHRRVEHWDNAVEQGRLAGANMLRPGAQEAFRHVPYFFSDAFDLSFEIWGDPEEGERIVHRGDLEGDAEGFSAWWLDGEDRLVAAFVMNRPAEERELAPEWIARRQPLPPAALSNEDRELAALAA